MNLTKSDLFFIFDSVDALSEKGSYQAEELAENAYSALYHDELEIEGYEKVQWVKFDPNDESTFPPREGMYLVCRGVEPYFREAKYYGDKVGFGDTCVILWRPLPKLPLEIDNRYIREDRPECFSCDDNN